MVDLSILLSTISSFLRLVLLHIRFCSPHRQAVRTLRCGRENPDSTPGVDIFYEQIIMSIAFERAIETEIVRRAFFFRSTAAIAQLGERQTEDLKVP